MVTARSGMGTARSEHTATLLPDGKVLVVGGGHEETLEEGPAYSATAELYEPGSGRWTATGSMATARVDHTATLLADGGVLVASGHGPGSDPEPLDSAELYDPASERWTATGSMAEATFYHTATQLADGRVLVAGGSDREAALIAGVEGSPQLSADLCDPSSRRWIASASMVTARASHTAILLPDGRVFFSGGSSLVSPAELYDPTGGS